jgi:hypothetical protein
MFPDFKELLSVLNEHRVKYLVVGAYAVSIYAQPRATKDLDILIKADAQNARKVFTALAQFGAPLEGLTAADFAERGPFFRMGREPVCVDVLTEIPGVDFDAAWQFPGGKSESVDAHARQLTKAGCKKIFRDVHVERSQD